jgi:hypothetical protein
MEQNLGPIIALGGESGRKASKLTNERQRFGIRISSIKRVKVAIERIENFHYVTKTKAGVVPVLLAGFKVLVFFIFQIDLDIAITFAVVKGYRFDVDEKEMVLWCIPPQT